MLIFTAICFGFAWTGLFVVMGYAAGWHKGVQETERRWSEAVERADASRTALAE